MYNFLQKELSNSIKSSSLKVKILKALKGLHVYDRSSGFVYNNLDIFACNADADSVPCLWDIHTRSTDEPLYVRDVDDLEKTIGCSVAQKQCTLAT